MYIFGKNIYSNMATWHRNIYVQTSNVSITLTPFPFYLKEGTTGYMGVWLNKRQNCIKLNTLNILYSLKRYIHEYAISTWQIHKSIVLQRNVVYKTYMYRYVSQLYSTVYSVSAFWQEGPKLEGEKRSSISVISTSSVSDICTKGTDAGKEMSFCASLIACCTEKVCQVCVWGH